MKLGKKRIIVGLPSTAGGCQLEFFQDPRFKGTQWKGPPKDRSNIVCQNVVADSLGSKHGQLKFIAIYIIKWVMLVITIPNRSKRKWNQEFQVPVAKDYFILFFFYYFCWAWNLGTYYNLWPNLWSLDGALDDCCWFKEYSQRFEEGLSPVEGSYAGTGTWHPVHVGYPHRWWLFIAIFFCSGYWHSRVEGLKCYSFANDVFSRLFVIRGSKVKQVDLHNVKIDLFSFSHVTCLANIVCKILVCDSLLQFVPLATWCKGIEPLLTLQVVETVIPKKDPTLVWSSGGIRDFSKYHVVSTDSSKNVLVIPSHYKTPRMSKHSQTHKYFNNPTERFLLQIDNFNFTRKEKNLSI